MVSSSLTYFSCFSFWVWNRTPHGTPGCSAAVVRKRTRSRELFATFSCRTERLLPSDALQRRLRT